MRAIVEKFKIPINFTIRERSDFSVYYVPDPPWGTPITITMPFFANVVGTIGSLGPGTAWLTAVVMTNEKKTEERQFIFVPTEHPFDPIGAGFLFTNGDIHVFEKFKNLVR